MLMQLLNQILHFILPPSNAFPLFLEYTLYFEGRVLPNYSPPNITSVLPDSSYQLSRVGLFAPLKAIAQLVLTLNQAPYYHCHIDYSA
jgi:hypothetical protein